MNLKDILDAPSTHQGGGGRSSGNFGLVREPSVFSLTFEEFQNSMGGLRKDMGSMNMDELLKNIWTAEETQPNTTMTTMSSFGGEPQVRGMQRQGSLTLPRTLSQKTVDEVWKELFKESECTKDESGTSATNLPQRQQTLGEMTLEEFLVKAGVVSEEAQSAGGPESTTCYGELLGPSNISGLALGFGQPDQTNVRVANPVTQSRNPPVIPFQFHDLAINVTRIGSSQPQQPQEERQFLTNKPSIAYNHAQLSSEGTRGGVMGIGDPIMKGLVQTVGLESGHMTVVGLGAGPTIATASPNLQSDELGKSKGETSSLLPVPCVFSGGLRERRCSGDVEKVVERRQRRMIKNRESAARSRARKQALTIKLEEEVAKLKKQNDDLKKKQEEIMDIQENRILKAVIQQKFAKKRRLRRTFTGPW